METLSQRSLALSEQALQRPRNSRHLQCAQLQTLPREVNEAMSRNRRPTRTNVSYAVSNMI